MISINIIIISSSSSVSSALLRFRSLSGAATCHVSPFVRQASPFVHHAGLWQLRPLGMTQFIHAAFSKSRADAVERMQELVGDAVFKKTHWFVADGERSAYLDAGAFFVQETGDLCHTVQHAIDMANTKKKPLALMSDDVRGFFCKQGDPAAWPSWRGRQLAIGNFASQILQAMRQVGTPLGGVYHMAAARTQLLMPTVSYHHFCNLDFLVLDPPFPLQLHCDARVNVKVDYHLTASALAAFGAICRVNRLSIDAPHYRTGGAGTMKERKKSDKAAAKWLMKHWAPSKFKKVVFRQNLQRSGNWQVSMCGTPLLRQCDSRLEELHRALHKAGVSSKMCKKDVKRAIKRCKVATSRKKKLAIGSGRTKKKDWHTYKRLERGTSTTGPIRRAGRLAAGKASLTMKTRQALSRARRELRKVVLELRRKRQRDLRG